SVCDHPPIQLGLGLSFTGVPIEYLHTLSSLLSIGCVCSSRTLWLDWLRRNAIWCNPHRIQKRHQVTQAGAYLLDRVLLFAFPRGIERRPPGFVFSDPF